MSDDNDLLRELYAPLDVIDHQTILQDSCFQKAYDDLVEDLKATGATDILPKYQLTAYCSLGFADVKPWVFYKGNVTVYHMDEELKRVYRDLYNAHKEGVITSGETHCYLWHNDVICTLLKGYYDLGFIEMSSGRLKLEAELNK